MYFYHALCKLEQHSEERSSMHLLVQGTFISVIALMLLLLPQFALLETLSGEETICDPDLNSPIGDPLGYSLRGDRCEGRYIQEVGSTTLLVASMTGSFEEYDLTSGKNLLVEWTAAGDASVRLRAQGLRRRLYYRMDTMVPPEMTSYNWPLNILTALKIPRKDIGVIGWTPYAIGGVKRDVLVPLRIRQKGNTSRSRTYCVVLLPGRELTEVFISLAPVGADGLLGRFLQDGRPLEYGYYPAEHSIEFPISDLEAPGVYYLQIGATLMGGGVATTELWFYHSD